MRTADAGVFSVQNRDFEAVLRSLIGDWLDAHPSVPILAAGMIGSANGWREAPYVPTPTTMRALRENLVQVPLQRSSHVLRIIPGVRHGQGSDTDVMRGEETQIFGALGNECDGLFCLPGTHCKWAVVQGGAIVDFRTHYTGELYAWLSTQSSVGKVLDARAPFDAAAFDEGAARAFAAPESLLHQLFALRASVVAKERSAAYNASAAQGVLIGNDCALGLAYLRRKWNDWLAMPIHVVGGANLAALYARVLDSQGVACMVHEANVTVIGLQRIFASTE